MRYLGSAAIVLLLAAVGGSALAAGDAGEGGGGGLGEALITPQIGTFFWLLVTFVAMALILGRYAWKPLVGALETREKSIQESLDQVRREREEAEGLLREHQELVAQARRERAEALALGERDAEKVKAEILEEAKQQREHLLKQTDEQVQASLRQARGELRSYAADLAIQAAGKLLVKNLDDATNRQVVEDCLSDLERSAGGNGPLPS